MFWFCEVVDGPWVGNYICHPKNDTDDGIVRNEAQMLRFATRDSKVGEELSLISPSALQGIPSTPEELREYQRLHIYQISSRADDSAGVQMRLKYHGSR